MPPADNVVSWATAVANDWRWLAAFWHFALAALLIALIRRSDLSQRRLGMLLVLPLTSVGMLAWATGNPFNGATFTVLAILLLHAARHVPQVPVQPAPAGWLVAGSGLVVFGWAYPHFLETDTWTAYAYASPFGLLPCPTLSVVIGITMIFGGLRSRQGSALLCAAGLAYGVIGLAWLRVTLDVWLLAGAFGLGAMLVAERLRWVETSGTALRGAG